MAAFLAGWSGEIYAEEGPIAAVQNALIRKQFLTGEPSGVLDDRTRGALQRFQIRRSLPPTGEIDTATILALQSKNLAVTATAPEPPAAPAPALVQSDREFLKKVEQAQGEKVAPPEEAPAEPQVPLARTETAFRQTAPIAAGDAGIGNTENDHPRATPHIVTNREGTSAVKRDDPSRQKEAAGEAELASPPRPPQTIGAIAPAATVDTENDADVLGSHGTRIIRSKTTTIMGADGRTHVSEKRTTTSAGTPPPEIRRAIAIEPRPKDNGFFHRLFHAD